MTQSRDPGRLIGRTVLLVENGTSRPAHVVAAGNGGIRLQLDDEQRFLAHEDLSRVELDADPDHVAAGR